MDFSKAFDKILLLKRHRLGIYSRTVKLNQSFLIDRSQCIGGEQSDYCPILFQKFRSFTGETSNDIYSPCYISNCLREE